MKRPDETLLVCVLLTGILEWRGEHGLALLAVLAALAYALIDRAMSALRVQEEHRAELHALRLELSALGDPEIILRRLDELAAGAEKVKHAPESVDGLRDAVKATTGGLDERLKKVEGFLSAELTRAGLDRRGLRFGQE